MQGAQPLGEMITPDLPFRFTLGRGRSMRELSDGRRAQVPGAGTQVVGGRTSQLETTALPLLFELIDYLLLLLQEALRVGWNVRDLGVEAAQSRAAHSDSGLGQCVHISFDTKVIDRVLTDKCREVQPLFQQMVLRTDETETGSLHKVFEQSHQSFFAVHSKIEFKRQCHCQQQHTEVPIYQPNPKSIVQSVVIDQY